jgi:hypothetical protein
MLAKLVIHEKTDRLGREVVVLGVHGEDETRTSNRVWRFASRSVGEVLTSKLRVQVLDAEGVPAANRVLQAAAVCVALFLSGCALDQPKPIVRPKIRYISEPIPPTQATCKPLDNTQHNGAPTRPQMLSVQVRMLAGCSIEATRRSSEGKAGALIGRAEGTRLTAKVRAKRPDAGH